MEIPESYLSEIRDHAEREYPYECCGIVVGTPEGAWIVHPCANVQDELHRRNPSSFSRDARTAYYIDPREQMRIFQDAEKRGWTIRGFYHSHPDHPARFSEEDEQRAMPWGTPLYPEVFHLIVEVLRGSARHFACFAWDDGLAKFVERCLANK